MSQQANVAKAKNGGFVVTVWTPEGDDEYVAKNLNQVKKILVDVFEEPKEPEDFPF